MSVTKREDIIELNKRIEAEAKTLRAKLNEQADLSEVEEVVANLNELLHSRELTKALLTRFGGRYV